jgi:hypothetical protein
MTHVPSGTVVTSLRGSLMGEDQPFEALTSVLQWLAIFGVGPASITSMAWRLLEASLPTTLHVHADPEIGRAAFYGGRQEVRLRPHRNPSTPSRYHAQHLLDIKAAYPAQMAARPFALSLREVDPSTTIDATTAGIAEAMVDVPTDIGYGPLPMRLAPDVISFQTGRLHGTWAWCELAAAAAGGCTVEVRRSWAPRREFDLFATWWSMAQTGRSLDQGAGVAKALAVTTWGPFAMAGDGRAEVHWRGDGDGDAYEVPLPDRHLPHEHATHIAAEVTARVRTQLLVEALWGIGVTPVHVDTDGIIVRATSPLPDNAGDGFGQWRVKTRMPSVEIAAPQLYRYVCGCGQCIPNAKYHYVASGMTEDAAKWLFDHHGQVTRISYLARDDATVPATMSYDMERINALLGEARLRGRGIE